MSKDRIEIVLDSATGSVRFIHSDEAMALVRNVGGRPSVRRASHVEPVGGSASWEADMSPVGGPKLGPFPTRREALDAEVAWLNENHLYCRECRDEAGDQALGGAAEGMGGRAAPPGGH
jgi:hypothetical protein